MKNIKYIYVFAFLLFVVNSFGQQLPKGFKEKIQREYNAIPKAEKKQELKMTFNEYFELRKESYLSQQAFYKSLTQKSVSDLCSNGTFENGEVNIGDWNFYWQGGSSSNLQYGTNRINSGGLLTGTPTNHSTQVHHKVVGIGTDPTFPSLNQVPSFPTGNQYSLRLGNKHPWFGLESVSKVITITPANATLSFSYAIVTENPSGHNNNKPYFGVFIKDVNTNANYSSLVDLGGGSNTIVSNNPLLTPATGLKRWKDWACVTADLSSLIGKTVIITFENRDCKQGGHWAYSYIDNICLGCADAPSDEGKVQLNPGESDNCGIPGKICVTYQLPINPNTNQNGTGQINLDIIQNGNVVNTISSPTLSSGSSYCFNLTGVNTTGLNTSLGGFDFKITGNFALGNFNFTPQVLGNSSSGQDAIQNNDYQISCVQQINCDDCCKTKLDIWNVHGTLNPLVASPMQTGLPGQTQVPYSMASEVFEIHQNSGIPITELRVNITDIKFEYNYKACSDCKDNPALWASLIPGQGSVGGLTTPIAVQGSNINDQENIREIVWQNSNGVLLQNGTTFKVNYMLPAISDIPCCVSTVKVCIRISWKDANCNICEVNTCSTIQLGKK